MDILFDFSSSIQTVKIGQTTTTVKNKKCEHGFVFDPFTEKCIKVYVLDRPISNNDSYVRYKCSKGSGFVEINLLSITMWPNGSIWIPLHKKTYDNGSYFINGSRAFICMNLTRHFTETTTIFSENANFKRRQILTFVGCAISMISLILLLAVYITITELRTLPGKKSDEFVKLHAVLSHRVFDGRPDRLSIPLHGGICCPSLFSAVIVLLDECNGF